MFDLLHYGVIHMLHRVANEKWRVSELVLFVPHSNDPVEISLVVDGRRDTCYMTACACNQDNHKLCSVEPVSFRQKFRSSRLEDLFSRLVCCLSQDLSSKALTNIHPVTRPQWQIM